MALVVDGGGRRFLLSVTSMVEAVGSGICGGGDNADGSSGGGIFECQCRRWGHTIGRRRPRLTVAVGDEHGRQEEDD